MGEKDKKAGPTKRKPKKHSESVTVSSEQLESHTLHEDEEMQPPSETLPTKNVLDENKDETEHVAAANLVAEVVDDLLASSTFLDKLRTVIKSMVQTVVDTTYQRLFESMEENRGSIHDLRVNTTEIEKDFQKLQDLVDSQQEQLNILKRANNDLEQYSRRNCVRIFGIPEEKDENPDDLVINDIFKKRLELDISPSAIERCHRVGKPDPDPEKHRAIIVKFCSYRVRKQVIASRRRLKKSGISIQEDLTMKNQALYRKVYKTVKANPSKVVSTWTSDGRIFAELKTTGKKTIKIIISSEADLARLQ